MTDTIVSLQEANIYVKKNLILTGVNLHVQKNEFVYLIGKTGSGKSSLLRVLFGDIKLNQGQGNVVGFSLNKLKNKEIPFLRRKLGIVFQDFQLLGDRTAKDNLLFVLKATGWTNKQKTDDRINEVLQKVGLGTKGFKMPHELSGGEQQRLAIARALLNEPELILADEPSGNLDPETSNEIMNLFFELSKTRCSVIMATHNYSLIERFPARIIKLETGKVLES
ncbi:MAG TPA: ATP-binding cassette domain-containing protein [Bacteroidia bacterium]|nr:ATP-binding cassette domain-containing protein [Bacteroidia bacterium]HMU18531.1 ATP-binding cassette domain-containing protein [Bacteroidia bacterium]